MMARLKLLAEGGVLAGTPDEYIARHEAANAARAARREQVHRDIADQTGWTDDNLDLVGG